MFVCGFKKDDFSFRPLLVNTIVIHRLRLVIFIMEYRMYHFILLYVTTIL